MNRRSRIFRLTTLLATTSMVAAGFLAGAPSVQAQDAGIQSAGDPPGRVGRLARLDGTVSTHGAGSTQWTPAVLNFPFVSGDALWTQPQAQADIEVGDDLATLADSTELDLASLDDHNLVASEPQGAVFLDLRDVQPGDTYTINTPRGAVQIAGNGEYEILAGDTNTPTRVAVVRGAAQLTSGSLALRAGPGQMAVASGDQDIQGDVEPLSSYDPFLTAMLARNSAPVDAPQAVQGMTGVQGLAQYGAWQQSPGYGQVWYPQVAPDWVPYRDGSWSYVAPWGWTWVDNEPWGFAPFHYGRWAQVDQRWCWVPTQEGAPYDPEPTYAPALVDFLVAGAVAGAVAGVLAASLSSGRGDVGWVPLGPREAYDPPYGGSSRYHDRLNWGRGWHQANWNVRDHNTINNIRNTTIINNHNTTNVFINQRALTVAPAAAMVRSQQIRPVSHGFDSAGGRGFQTASVQSLRGPLPIRPVAETRGLTPQAARRFGIADGLTHPVAPGPAITPAVLRSASAPGGRIPFRSGTAPTGTSFPGNGPAGHAPGPALQHAIVRPGAPVSPQAGRPAIPFRPQQPNVPLQPARPVFHQPEAGHAPIQPGAETARRPDLPAPPRVFRAQPVQRMELPRPGMGAPQPQAFHAEPPRMATPGMGPPRGMMQQPHLQAARPVAPRALGGPAHP